MTGNSRDSELMRDYDRNHGYVPKRERSKDSQNKGKKVRKVIERPIYIDNRETVETNRGSNFQFSGLSCILCAFVPFIIFIVLIIYYVGNRIYGEEKWGITKYIAALVLWVKK